MRFWAPPPALHSGDGKGKGHRLIAPALLSAFVLARALMTSPPEALAAHGLTSPSTSSGPYEALSQSKGSPRAEEEPLVLSAPGGLSKDESRHTGRAAVELSALIGTGTVIHYSKRENNRAEFVYQPTWGGLKGKVTGGWEFDTNTFVVNSLGHVYDGVLYYQIGRSNGFGPLGSLGFSFGGSLAWEYVGEFTDRVSANDMIVTGVAGAVLGETFHQTSLLVERSGLPRPVKLPLAIVFDPLRKLNEWWDAKPRPTERRSAPVSE